MKTVNIKSPGGWDIPADYTIEGHEAMVCVIAHGFGSSRKSSTAQMMLEHCKALGMGAVAFDWPCHGGSEAPYAALTIDNCQRDLQAVEQWAVQRAPGAEIVYFGSSFGGYNTLLHLCSGVSLGHRAVLRSCAVDMDTLFTIDTPGVREQIAEKGYYHYDPGFGHGLDLCETFFETLAGNSPFKLTLPDGVKVHLIHGMDDDVVDPAEAYRYAAEKRVPITLIPATGHGIDSELGISTLLRLTASFYTQAK